MRSWNWLRAAAASECLGDVRMKRVGAIATIVKLAVASVFLAIGICLYIEVSLGSDSIDVLLDGMSRTFGMTLGQADQIFVAVTLAIALLCNRKAVGAPSVIAMILGSLLIDTVNLWLDPLNLANQDIATRLVLLVLAQVALGGAYGVLQTVPRGTAFADAIVTRTSEIAPGSYVFWRLAYDAAYLLAGVALGGVFGVGTVFYIIVNGVSIKAAAKITAGIEHLLVETRKDHDAVLGSTD